MEQKYQLATSFTQSLNDMVPFFPYICISYGYYQRTTNENYLLSLFSIVGDKEKCMDVFERGIKAIALSADLWIHYLNHVKTEFKCIILYKKVIIAIKRISFSYRRWKKIDSLFRFTVLFPKSLTEQSKSTSFPLIAVTFLLM